MKQWKKMLLSLLLCLALTGCQTGPSAEDVAEALCKLYVHADTKVSSVLKDWDTANVKDTIENQLSEQLRSNLQAVGVQTVDSKALAAVTESIMEAREKIPIDVEVIETAGEKVSLQITVGSLDISGIDRAAAEEAMSELSGLSELSEADLERFVEAYTEALQSGFDEADPSENQNTFTVDFVEKNGLWLPEDLNGFVELLGQYIRR